MEPESSLPHSQEPATCPYHQRISPGPRLCDLFRNMVFFTMRTCQHLAQPPSWRTTPCRLSATAYPMYSQLPSISGGRSSIRNPRTRHAVVTGTHLSWRQGPTYHGDRDTLQMVTGTDLSWWRGHTYHGDRDPLIMAKGTELSWWQRHTWHGDRDRLIMAKGTHLTWWQGPTYHGDRDRLIMVTDRLIMVTGTHSSWWQGPTYHGDRDTLVMVTGTQLSWW
jgi:hypothetical protein